MVLKKIIKYFFGVNPLKLLLVILIVSVSVAFCFDFFMNEQSNGSSFDEIPIWEKLFLILIVGPILETLFLNYLPILVLKNFTKNNFVFLIFNSTIFSLLHNYSWVYIFFAFLSALLLNIYFLIIMIEKNEMEAIKFTVLLHFSYNLTIFIMSDLLKIM